MAISTRPEYNSLVATTRLALINISHPPAKAVPQGATTTGF